MASSFGIVTADLGILQLVRLSLSSVILPIAQDSDSESALDCSFNSRLAFTRRIQPVLATPLTEEVLHGAKCKAGVSVDRSSSDVLAGRAIAWKRDRASLLATDRHRHSGALDVAVDVEGYEKLILTGRGDKFLRHHLLHIFV